MNPVKEYYSTLNIPSDSFKLQLTKKEEVSKILSNADTEKVCGLDKIPKILAEATSQDIIKFEAS